jgi:hypothetical protein
VNRSLFHRVVSIDDPAGLESLNEAVRDWEPSLELFRPRTDALLYEPDGTLYAVCLADKMTLRTDRREQVVRWGDAVVVPRAFAVDAGPRVDLLALRHDGPPPDHFRERFIQVWGFDYFPSPLDAANGAGFRDVISAADVRLRVPYAVADVGVPLRGAKGGSADLVIVVCLDGGLDLTVGKGAEMRRLELPSRTAAAVLPSTPFRIEGEGRAGVLTVLNELAHEARRREPGSSTDRPLSPEYRSGGRAE